MKARAARHWPGVIVTAADSVTAMVVGFRSEHRAQLSTPERNPNDLLNGSVTLRTSASVPPVSSQMQSSQYPLFRCAPRNDVIFEAGSLSAFLSLTPGPAPFSSTKITPAASRAERIFSRLLIRASWPASKRLMVLAPTSALRATACTEVFVLLRGG